MRRGFIILSGLGHCIVWHIVVNVLEEISGCIFTGRRKMDAACPDRNFGSHHQITWSPNPDDYSFES